MAMVGPQVVDEPQPLRERADGGRLGVVLRAAREHERQRAHPQDEEADRIGRKDEQQGEVLAQPDTPPGIVQNELILSAGVGRDDDRQEDARKSEAKHGLTPIGSRIE